MFLIEASLHKLDAMLKMPSNVHADTGYIDARHVLGPRANNEVVSLAQSLVDQLKAKRLELPRAVLIPIHAIKSTQHSIYFDDVADILRKQAFDKPITVMRYKGQLFVVNGHHRLAAAAVSDRDAIMAQVIAA
jgi:hypothetical protein